MSEELAPISFADAFALASTLIAMDDAMAILTDHLGLDRDRDASVLAMRAARVALEITYTDETAIAMQREISMLLADSQPVASGT